MARILLVGKGAPERGGIPVFLDMLQRSSLRDRHEIRLLNVSHGGVPEGGRLCWGNIRRTVGDCFSVSRAAKHADIVHIHSALAPLVTLLRASLLALAGRVRGAKVVLHVHGGRFQSAGSGPLRDRLLRLLLAPMDHAIAVATEGEARLLDILARERVTLVVNGIETGAFRTAVARTGVPRVLHVGLLTPRKGVIDLMTASDLLVERGVPHELWLVGGTPDEGPTDEQLVRRSAGSATRFLGTRAPEELPALYAQADVFCLASWWEATPLTVLEAMASGLAVVATDVGGVPQLVTHGETGLLVPPRDPRSLADAIEQLLGHDAVRAAMAEAGKRRVQLRHDFSRVAEEIHQVYEASGGVRSVRAHQVSSSPETVT